MQSYNLSWVNYSNLVLDDLLGVTQAAPQAKEALPPGRYLLL